MDLGDARNRGNLQASPVVETCDYGTWMHRTPMPELSNSTWQSWSSEWGIGRLRGSGGEPEKRL